MVRVIVSMISLNYFNRRKITLKYFDLSHDVSYKTLIDSKPLRIRFNKIDGFIRIYDGTRYLTLVLRS